MESEQEAPAVHAGLKSGAARKPETPEAIDTGGIPERGFGFRSDAGASAPTGPTVISMPGPKAEPVTKHEEPAEATQPADYELELVDVAPKSSAAPPKGMEGPWATWRLSLKRHWARWLRLWPGMVRARAWRLAVRQRRGFDRRLQILLCKAPPIQAVHSVKSSTNFRQALDELQTEEDPETHYNLGIAYREMGLLEEAISEFQKVAQAHDRGKVFRYAMQCCTLLGLAFMEKGQPEIAAFWYERSLQTPGLDLESILALRYDLGVAQELAGQTEGALKSFQQVYAMNIDYRDVSDRITTLRKR